jgi:hypothetical protein
MDSSENSARAVAAIACIDAVPTLLKVLCEITGMRVAVVARVTDKTWTACAVKDEAHLGLKPGMDRGDPVLASIHRAQVLPQ